MMILNNSFKNCKMKFFLISKIAIFIILSGICQYYKDENAINETLEYGNKLDISLDIRNHRMLANYDKQNDMMYGNYQNKTHDSRENHKLVNRRDNYNTYVQLKLGRPNNVEAYLNSFKYRHSKKSALKKLDCYYEKKFFNSLDKIEKLAKQKNFSNSQIKKILYKKYGLPLIILCLIPLLGLILPIKFFKTSHIITGATCRRITKHIKGTSTAFYNHENCTFLPAICRFVNYFFFTTFSLILILLIFYMYIKVLKYRRIKAGMLK